MKRQATEIAKTPLLGKESPDDEHDWPDFMSVVFAKERPYVASQDELEKILEMVNEYYKAGWKEYTRPPFRMHHLTMENMVANLNKILMASHPARIRNAYDQIMNIHQDCTHDLVFDRLMRDDANRKDRRKILQTLTDGAPSAYQTDDFEWPKDKQFNWSKAIRYRTSDGRFNLTEYLQRRKSRTKDIFVRLKHDKTEHDR